MMTASWAPMMAAMMLPSAVPTIARRVREHHGVLAVALVAAAVLYELTPLKRACRRRCREERPLACGSAAGASARASG
jgi:predicted metal-binding membrane protein